VVFHSLRLRMNNRIRSDFLVADTSFVTGAGRLLDWYGIYNSYNTSRTGEEADARALFADWALVGQDIWSAMAEFEEERSDDYATLEPRP
jgi:hypothetical protein